MIEVPESVHDAALRSKPVVAAPPTVATSAFVHETQRLVAELKKNPDAFNLILKLQNINKLNIS